MFDHLSGIDHSDFTTTHCVILENHPVLSSLYFLLLKPTDFEPNIAVSALLEEHNTTCQSEHSLIADMMRSFFAKVLRFSQHESLKHVFLSYN